jgi:Trk K+ transport system NAD-binding subunit
MTPASHHSAFFLVLRRMRAPLITLIVIFSVSVLGMTLVPGLDPSGQPRHMSFFHALYFISYTATTIGFGEIPHEFSEQQRLWALVCIYMSVIGWAYTLGTVFALLQDQTFQGALRTERFARAVRRIGEPFYLICGYGETGRLICRALDRLGRRAVVLECDDTKAGEIDLHEYVTDIPVLKADASKPELLRFAGLTSRHCVGVMALTNDDQANLAVAISARLLAPQLPALCRVQHAETAANMASFGTRHIINPFEKFADYLALALHAPAAYHLLTWLTGLPGSTVPRHRDPPRGHWVLCGHGSFGSVMVGALDSEGVPVTIIDRAPPSDPEHRWVKGEGTGAPALIEAGVRDAVGIVATTGSDVDNLSIVVTARELNPALFTILRQNHYSNRALFDAFESDLVVVPSQIIAHECLAILTTPLLVPFLRAARKRDEAWCDALVTQLTGRFGWEVPSVWSVRVDAADSPALAAHLASTSVPPSISALLASPQSRGQLLPCEVLFMQRRTGEELVTPSADVLLQPGDHLLLVGRPGARRDLALTLGNQHTLSYVLSGKELPGGYVWEWLAGRKKPA